MSSDVTRKLQLSSSCCLLSCSSSSSRAAGRPASRPTGRLASCHRLQRRRQANVPQANPPLCHLATSASSHESRDFIDDTIKHNQPFNTNPFHSNYKLRMETDMVFLLNMLNMTTKNPFQKKENIQSHRLFCLAAQQQCTVGCADLTDDGNGLH